MKYVTEEEFAAICTDNARRVRHDALVAKIKRYNKRHPSLTLAQKLEKLKAIK